MTPNDKQRIDELERAVWILNRRGIDGWGGKPDLVEIDQRYGPKTTEQREAVPS
jgi:hypothetical protein